LKYDVNRSTELPATAPVRMNWASGAPPEVASGNVMSMMKLSPSEVASIESS
jgi:hypothetical protein